MSGNGVLPLCPAMPAPDEAVVKGKPTVVWQPPAYSAMLRDRLQERIRNPKSHRAGDGETASIGDAAMTIPMARTGSETTHIPSEGC